MNLPISIIVPIYNAKYFLPQCIESILAQTFSKFELLLVDDGSTDTSLNICTKYAKTDTRITVFHKENEGVTATRKYGVEMAKGEYICFVDADDTLPVSSLQDLYLIHNDTDIIIGTYEEVYTNKKRAHTITGIPLEFTGIDYIRFQLKNTLFHSPWAKLIKKTCFDETTLDIPRTIFRGEDFLMNIRLGMKAKTIKIINKTVYHYIIRSSSCMQSKKPSLEYEKLFDSYLSQFLEKSNLCDSVKNELIHQRADAVAGLILAKCQLDQYDPFLRRVRGMVTFSSGDFVQILIKILYEYPILFRLCYKTGRKLAML